MGTTRLQARQGLRSDGGRSQPEPDTSRGLNNSLGVGETVAGRLWSIAKKKQERQAKEQAAGAALSAAEQEAQEKTASMAASAGGVASTNGYGSSTHIEGNPGQGDNQSQGDGDLSTSDTTLRRRGSYRRDSGMRI